MQPAERQFASVQTHIPTDLRLVMLAASLWMAACQGVPKVDPPDVSLAGAGSDDNPVVFVQPDASVDSGLEEDVSPDVLADGEGPTDGQDEGDIFEDGIGGDEDAGNTQQVAEVVSDAAIDPDTVLDPDAAVEPDATPELDTDPEPDATPEPDTDPEPEVADAGPVEEDGEIGPSPMPTFSLVDHNETSSTYEDPVSPSDYLQMVSGWYFTHAS